MNVCVCVTTSVSWSKFVSACVMVDGCETDIQ